LLFKPGILVCHVSPSWSPTPGRGPDAGGGTMAPADHIGHGAGRRTQVQSLGDINRPALGIGCALA
jgi:hypothetical protein